MYEKIVYTEENVKRYIWWKGAIEVLRTRKNTNFYGNFFEIYDPAPSLQSVRNASKGPKNYFHIVSISDTLNLMTTANQMPTTRKPIPR